MKRSIYLDSAATTKVHPQVVAEMNKYFTDDYGNPSSLHALGERARKAIDSARKKIADEINARPHEIYFTSGATEANNLALSLGKKVVASSIEHPSVSEVADSLSGIRIGVDTDGFVDLVQLEKVARGALVSIMHVNNIFGTIQDLERIGQICKRKGAIFHTDATQGFGKLKIDVRKMNIDLLSASGHKIGGPKGIGFLYVREGLNVRPLIIGGGQEKNLRSGTENVPGIMGFAKALELYRKINWKKIEKTRDRLALELEVIGGRLNGSRERRIYNNIHLSYLGIDNENLVAYLSQKGIYVSAGSACESKKEKDDGVLRAIGLTDKEIRGSVRLTLDEDFNEKDIALVVGEFSKVVKKLNM